MNYRNNPNGANRQFPTHGEYRHGQSQHSQYIRNRSGGYRTDAETSAIMPASDTPFPSVTPLIAPVPAMAMAEPVVLPAQEMLPSVTQATLGELVEAAPPAAKAGGFSLSGLSDIKGLVDRMGGIDGILSTVQKVQKVVSSVSQMAPLVKVLLSSFKKSSSDDSDDDSAAEWKPTKRKRRKRRPSAAVRRPTAVKRPKAKRRR